jgi:hypothetical protein
LSSWNSAWCFREQVVCRGSVQVLFCNWQTPSSHEVELPQNWQHCSRVVSIHVWCWNWCPYQGNVSCDELLSQHDQAWQSVLSLSFLQASENLTDFVFQLEGYSDSDYVKDLLQRRSVSGVCSFLEGGVLNAANCIFVCHRS